MMHQPGLGLAFLQRLQVVSRTGLSQTQAAMAVETVFEMMKRTMSQGERIELRGCGVFKGASSQDGGWSQSTHGVEVSIPPDKAVRFKPVAIEAPSVRGEVLGNTTPTPQADLSFVLNKDLRVLWSATTKNCTGR